MRNMMMMAASALALVTTALPASAITQAELDAKITEIRGKLRQDRIDMRQLQRSIALNTRPDLQAERQALLGRFQQRIADLEALMETYKNKPISG